MRSDFEYRIDKFTIERSGWAVIGVLNHDPHGNNSYSPLAARSNIQLADEIQNQKSHYQY